MCFFFTETIFLPKPFVSFLVQGMPQVPVQVRKDGQAGEDGDQRGQDGAGSDFAKLPFRPEFFFDKFLSL
jgi:hypothetical protein